MQLQYRMLNAPSQKTIELAHHVGCNWVLVHSAGIHGDSRAYKSGPRRPDSYLIYFDDYPKLARLRRQLDAEWIEPAKAQTLRLMDLAVKCDMKVALHTYEPSFPHEFPELYPEIVQVWHRPTQTGVVPVYSHVDPTNPRVWELFASKYREMVEALPQVSMIIVSTWDGDGSYLCVPQDGPAADMPAHERLARLVLTIRQAVRSIRPDVITCFRLWGRNFAPKAYRHFYSLADRWTGRRDSSDLLEPVRKPSNDPDVVLPKLLAALPSDVPIMYKSTPDDIHACQRQSLTSWLGRFPADRTQILEISFERRNEYRYPAVLAHHITNGFDAIRRHHLHGVIGMPSNMGSNDRACDPTAGGLGRVNWSIFAARLAESTDSDSDLLTTWLTDQYASPPPQLVVHALLDVDRLAGDGLGWGYIPCHQTPFRSLHEMKIYWAALAWCDPAFPDNLQPTADCIEGWIARKQTAAQQAADYVQQIRQAGSQIPPKLSDELLPAYQLFAGMIALAAAYHTALLIQWGIETAALPPDRYTLTRMERAWQSFARQLADAAGTPLLDWAARMPIPDTFDIPH